MLATLSTKEREIQDDQGHWYLMRLMPYRTAENVIDGVVVTIIDVDRARKAETAGAAALMERDFFESIVQTVREPLMVLDEQLRVVLTNESFHRMFRTRLEEIENRHLYELSNGRWDIPDLRIVTLLHMESPMRLLPPTAQGSN